MLGSYFDLKREISQIAARRAAEEAETRTPVPTGVYSDFDAQICAFVEAFDVDDKPVPAPRRAIQAEQNNRA